MVYMPLSDLRIVWAKRKVDIAMNRECARHAARQSLVIKGLDEQIIHRDVDIARLDSTAKSEQNRRMEVTADLVEVADKAASFRTWATIGKISIGIVGVTVLTTAVVAIKNSFTP